MNADNKIFESATPPWGKWEVILDEPGYKVKQITVEPDHQLSYQTHAKRQEHWVAVKGEGIVILDGREIILKPGDTLDVPIGIPHRAINRGDEPFIFIEVQLGSYLGEDDIVRLEDSYGRV